MVPVMDGSCVVWFQRDVLRLTGLDGEALEGEWIGWFGAAGTWTFRWLQLQPCFKILWHVTLNLMSPVERTSTRHTQANAGMSCG